MENHDDAWEAGEEREIRTECHVAKCGEPWVYLMYTMEAKPAIVRGKPSAKAYIWCLNRPASLASGNAREVGWSVRMPVWKRRSKRMEPDAQTWGKGEGKYNKMMLLE